MIEKRTLFQTSVYEDVDFLNDNQREDIINYTKSIDDKFFMKFRAFKGNFVTTFCLDKNKGIRDFIKKIDEDIPSCKGIMDKLNSSIKNTLDLYGHYSEDVILTDSWVNIQKPGSEILEHTHPGCLLSGLIVLKADKKSSPLYWYNPNPFLSYFDFDKPSIENFAYSWCNLQNNTLYLWPSYIRHGSQNNINESEERMTIGFNTAKKQ